MTEETTAPAPITIAGFTLLRNDDDFYAWCAKTGVDLRIRHKFGRKYPFWSADVHDGVNSNDLDAEDIAAMGRAMGETSAVAEIGWLDAPVREGLHYVKDGQGNIDAQNLFVEEASGVLCYDLYNDGSATPVTRYSHSQWIPIPSPEALLVIVNRLAKVRAGEAAETRAAEAVRAVLAMDEERYPSPSSPYWDGCAYGYNEAMRKVRAAVTKAMGGETT